jgi:hypothetical protein
LKIDVNEENNYNISTLNVSLTQLALSLTFANKT